MIEVSKQAFDIIQKQLGNCTILWGRDSDIFRINGKTILRRVFDNYHIVKHIKI